MTNSEWSWQLSDHLEGLSWAKLAGGQPFVFIQVGVHILAGRGAVLFQCLHIVLQQNLSHVLNYITSSVFSCFLSFTSFSAVVVTHYILFLLMHTLPPLVHAQQAKCVNYFISSFITTSLLMQGLDSPGGDYLVVEGAGGPEGLKEVCERTQHCLAFNTNGILKHSLLPPSKWVRWTNHPQHGLYVKGERRT